MTSPFDFLQRWLHDAARARQLRKGRQRRQLRLESLESRTLLAADTLAAIAGTAFVDLTDNGLTADDLRLPNATVQLYRDGGDGVLDRGAGGGDDTLAGSQLTDASGNYRFNDLVAGTYFAEQAAVAGRLRRADTAVRQIVVTAQDAEGVDGASIDSYDTTTQAVEASSLGPTSASSSAAAPEALGGERDLFVELTGGTGRIELLANAFAPGMLIFAADPSAVGRRVVSWDGADGNGASLSPAGLGGIDVTEDGANIALRLIMGADHSEGVATLYIYTDAANYSTASVSIPNTGTGAADVRVLVPFEEFVAAAGSGADFTNVGAIQLEIEGLAAVDGQIDDLGMIGPTVLAADFPYLPPLSVGDLVWRDANNNGIFDNGESGISGVQLTLYEDTDGNGQLTPGTDTSRGSTTTAADGTYRFENLLPGSYLVQVDPANFTGSGKLVGLVSSTGNEPTADPDNNVNGDDNGDPLSGQGVAAGAVTLTVGGEPTSDGDAGPDSNLTVDFGFAPISDLLVIKSDDPDPVVAGEDLTYTLHVTNQGPSPVTGATVTDTLPAGVTFKTVAATQGSGSHEGGTVTVNLGRLESGGTATITIVVNVHASTTGSLLNQAVVTGDNIDPVPLNNSDDEPTQVIQEIDLAIDKTDTPDPVVAGQQLTYTLLVTNHGPSNASGVTIADTLPAGVSFVTGTASQGTVAASQGVVTASLGNLAVGAQATVTLTVAVSSSARGVLLNEANVAGNETETDLTNNTDEVSTQISTLIDLAIDKTGSPDSVTPGQRLTYTLAVTNSGPSDATGVQVVDTLPAGVSFVSATSSQGSVSGSGSTVTANLGNLADGSQATITVLVDVAATASGTLVNAATVGGNETETNLANNADQLSTTVQPRVDLVIFKADSPDPVVAGSQLTYTLSVLNNGPSAASGVTVVDTLPAGVTYQSATTSQGTVSRSGSTVTAAVGQLASGASATVTILVNVDPTTRGTITNVATVTGNETETNSDNNRDDEPTQVQAQVDLTVTKADSADPVQAGGQLTYTIVVTNNGPSSATGVVLTDTLPSALTYVSGTSTAGTVGHAGQLVTANVGNLASGQNATITLVTEIDEQFSGTITNEAEVAGNETETNANNNTALEPTVIDALLSTISGAVYVDADNDGQRDTGEQPIGGVVVLLSGTDSTGATVQRQATTGADGTFSFSDLPRGTYRLTEQQPAGYNDGRDTVGNLAANSDTNDTFSGISLPAGTDAVNYLFGERTRTFSKRRFLSSGQ